MDNRQAAKKLASYGRHGDSMLLHVSPAEVAGLASLIPGGRLPVNPHTGLPEAFFFLPFLASLFGAAAPAAAAATAAAPAAATALGAGAAAGTAAATGAAGAAGTGLGATLAGFGGKLASGIGSLFGAGAPTAAASPLAATGAAAAPVAAAPVAAAPAMTGLNALQGVVDAAPGLVAPGVDPVITGSIGGAGAATPAATAATAPASGGLASLQAAGASPGSILPPAVTNAPMGANVGAAAPLTPTNIHSAALNAVTHPPNPTVSTTAHAANMAKINAAKAATPSAVDPWAGTREVTTAATEAPKTGKGGLGGLLKMENLLPMMLVGSMLKGSGGSSKSDDDDDDDDVDKYKYNQPNAVFPDKDYNAGLREWNYYPNNKYANGGIVRLAQGGPVPGADPQAQMPQDMSFPQNGIGSLVSPEQIPESPYPASQIGAEPPPAPEDEVAAPTANDSELIAQTVEAIQGKIPNPEQIMLAFVKEFGEPALQDLMMRVQTMAQGKGKPSDGTSDSVPALIDGVQPAALSEGEYVVPADVVSGIGNGSTDAGARQLDQMVGGTRQMRNGGRVQPAGYSNGGIVSLAEGGQVKQMPSKIRELLQAMGDIPLEPSRIISSPEYENESIMPAWMDQYVPSVRGMAITGSPFATEQEMRRELRRREDPELRRRENARRK